MIFFPFFSSFFSLSFFPTCSFSDSCYCCYYRQNSLLLAKPKRSFSLPVNHQCILCQIKLNKDELKIIWKSKWRIIQDISSYNITRHNIKENPANWRSRGWRLYEWTYLKMLNILNLCSNKGVISKHKINLKYSKNTMKCSKYMTHICIQFLCSNSEGGQSCSFTISRNIFKQNLFCSVITIHTRYLWLSLFVVKLQSSQLIFQSQQ